MTPDSALQGRATAALRLLLCGSERGRFGGNPLAAPVTLEALDILINDRRRERSAWLGEHLLARLKALKSPLVGAVHGRGLFVGVEFDPAWLIWIPTSS